MTTFPFMLNSLVMHHIPNDQVYTIIMLCQILGNQVYVCYKARKRVRIHVLRTCQHARKPHVDVLSFSEKRFNKHFLKLRENASTQAAKTMNYC